MRLPRRSLLASAFFVGSACGGSSTPSNPAPTQTVDDLLTPPTSCAFLCDETCEPQGYQCPALAEWKSLPHADSCGSWSGSFPAITGRCTASAPSGDAILPDGPTSDGAVIIPTGQRLKPAGKESVFGDFKGQFPANVVGVPASHLVVVVDGGIEEESVRLVDTDAVGTSGTFVVGSEKFTGTAGVNYGAVVLPGATPTDPLRLYVSGAAQGIIFAYAIDPTKKTLTRQTDSDIKVPPAKAGGLNGAYYFSGLAASPDGKKIFAATMNFRPASIVVLDVDPTSATYKTALRTIDVDARELFVPYVAPADTAGSTVFVSVWDAARIDVFSTSDGKKIASVDVGKNPEALALVGTRYLAVVSSDDDSIQLVDTLSSPPAKVASLPVVDGSSPGWSPSGLAWDDASKRLYVTLAGLNAVAAFDVTLPASGAPSLAPSGMLPTDWWPTAVTVRDDGSLVVVDGKGQGTGAEPIAWKPGQGDITARMRGSIQVIAKPDAATLTAGRTAIDASSDLTKIAGQSKVDCGGAAYDFPIPETNTGAPSSIIQHVIFVVKENKTFDGVYGDLPGVNGDASLIMAPGQMEIFQNEQAVAKAFTNFDNYYTSAEQSIQGHVWTAFARTTEFTERTWLVTWGRQYRGLPPQGVIPVGKPKEGSVFEWLQRQKVLFDDMGELIGPANDDGSTPKNYGYDDRYPGKLYAMDYPDTEKSCYMVARARVSCDLKPFSYAVQPNDHTSGGEAHKPTPSTYIAVGDEALGILVDGLSKSPLWSSTLLVVTEDDPQDGGDHVDAHRTPLLMISPWIKRGYVAKGHYDVASIHKLLAHVFAKPYPNEMVARAALPLEAFTSTPDYSPFSYLPRKTPLTCNPSGTKAATAAAMSHWDFSRPDEAPGIAQQIWEYFHPGAGAAPVGDGDGDD